MDDGGYLLLGLSSRKLTVYHRRTVLRFGSTSISVFVSLFFSLKYFSQVSYLRKSYGSRLNVFAPIQDLSAMSKSGAEGRTLTAGVKNDLEVAGEQVLGDEYTEHVIQVKAFPTSEYNIICVTQQFLRLAAG